MLVAFVSFLLALLKGMVRDTWKGPVGVSYEQVIKTKVLGFTCAGSLLGTVLLC